MANILEMLLSEAGTGMEQLQQQAWCHLGWFPDGILPHPHAPHGTKFKQSDVGISQASTKSFT